MYYSGIVGAHAKSSLYLDVLPDCLQIHGSLDLLQIVRYFLCVHRLEELEGFIHLAQSVKKSRGKSEASVCESEATD